MPTLPFPACLPRRARLGFLLLAGAAVLRSETVALWLFDEAKGPVVSDAGPGRHHVTFPPGARLLPGRFGNALHGPVRREMSVPNDTRSWEPAGSDRVTASRLNLGAHDWTIETWLRLASDAVSEGAILEIGSRFPGELRLATRLSVAPGENAFVLRHLSPVAPGSALDESRVIERSDPGGPPSQRYERTETTWTLSDGPLESDRWMHVALVHVAAERSARLFIDGRVRAVAAMAMSALPTGGSSYATLGIGGDGANAFPGALDEVRVSDHAVYTAEFTPPASFARATAVKVEGAHAVEPR